MKKPMILLQPLMKPKPQQSGQRHCPFLGLDSFTYSRLITASAARLGLEHLHLVPYDLRHAGASEDLLTKRRSELEVQLRGRWRSVMSLKRYGKPGQSSAMMQEIPTHVIRYGNLVHALLGDLFSGRKAVPVPPTGPRH